MLSLFFAALNVILEKGSGKRWVCSMLQRQFQCNQVRNVEYFILLVMSELSTVRCDRALGLWLKVHGCRVSTESCRGGAVADGPCGGRR